MQAISSSAGPRLRETDISKHKPYRLGRGTGPEKGPSKTQTISSLMCSWPRRGACRKPNRVVLDRALAPGHIKNITMTSLAGSQPREETWGGGGSVSEIQPYPPWRGIGQRGGPIKTPTAASSQGPWPQEGAYRNPNFSILDGALAPGPKSTSSVAWHRPRKAREGEAARFNPYLC